MALQYSSTSSISATTKVKVLVCGESGVGKTMLCATAPKPIILSAEDGLLSLRKPNIIRVYGDNTAGISYDIPCVIIRNIDDLIEIYDHLCNDPEFRQFDTVCVDSISEIAEQVLVREKASVRDGRLAYLKANEAMEHIIKQFRGIPHHHVYMAGKIDNIKDDYTGIVMQGPSFPGTKLGIKAGHAVDESFRLCIDKDSKNNTFRYLQTAPDYRYNAKDRSGALQPREVPNLTYIFNKILGD